MRPDSIILSAVLLTAMAAGSPAGAAATLEGDPVDCVNPLSGTNGNAHFSRGNTVAAIVAPFGMTTWAPQTDGNAGPFYQMKHEQFEGIRATHQPSIWVRDYANFLITPVVGEWKGSVRDRASKFTHEDEIARPYYYAVDLKRYETTLELTPTQRSSMMRFNFPDTDEAAIVFHTEGEIEKVEDEAHRIRGKATHVTLGAPGGFGKYFVVEFPEPYESVEITRDGDMTTAAIHLPAVEEGEPVQMRIGTSFISYEQAELNLDNELPDWDFEAAKSRARDAWSEELARVDIKGATKGQRSTFYTALYRALQFPRKFHEPDEDGELRHYSPYDQGNLHEGRLYTDNGVWDTYRAAFPFLVLYYPEHNRNILEGWLNAYRQSGRLPKWPSPGHRSAMIGSHSDSLLADAWVKGIRSFDLEDAYAATRKNAYVNDGGRTGRDHLDEYKELGYVPMDKRKHAAAACTLEYAYGDWCVARLAKAAGDEETYRELMERAKNYRNVWHEESGFMRGRLSDGGWQEPFDPLAWGGPWTEGNAWQWLWAVQHDPYGLMELLGGREEMAAKLDEFMTMPSTSVVGTYGHKIHEMREVEYADMGQYAHINEPNHHVLFLYNHLGQPWKTQRYVRRVMDELYNIDGMVGDEDTGQMSAWYIFNAAGFYPFCPGSPYYTIGSPLFEETVIHLENDRTFTVRARDNSSENRYIQSARLNGEPVTRTWLHHDEVAAGGLLEFKMGSEPNKDWGSAEADLPPDHFRTNGGVSD